MSKHKRIWLLACLGLFTLGSLGVTSGCNTIEGAGEDVEAVGDAVSDTARDAKD